MKRNKISVNIKCEVHPETRERLKIEHFRGKRIRVSSYGSILINIDKLINVLKDFKKKMVAHSL